MYSQAQGPPQATPGHLGTWSVCGSINTGCGCEVGRWTHFLVQEALVFWANLPSWGQRSCVAAATSCLLPPLFYCTIPPALWGWAGDSAPSHPREGREGSYFLPSFFPTLVLGWNQGLGHARQMPYTEPHPRLKARLLTVTGACPKASDSERGR